MWSDISHNQGFVDTFPHGSTLEKLCQHSRLGCVLAGGLRREAAFKGEGQLGPSFLAQLQDPPTPSPTQVTAEAAVFVVVIVVFYAAIIVILLGTNMRHPSTQNSTSPSRRRRSRSRSRSRYRHKHELVMDPSSGAVSTKTTKKKRRDSLTYSGEIPETV